MKLAEIIEAARASEGETVAPRMIRFLASEGVLSPPEGKTRGAEYSEKHLSELIRYIQLDKAGYPLAAIKTIACSHEIAPGVMLVAYSGRLDPAMDVAAASAKVLEILNNLVKETNHADDIHPPAD